MSIREAATESPSVILPGAGALRGTSVEGTARSVASPPAPGGTRLVGEDGDATGERVGVALSIAPLAALRQIVKCRRRQSWICQGSEFG